MTFTLKNDQGTKAQIIEVRIYVNLSDASVILPPIILRVRTPINNLQPTSPITIVFDASSIQNTPYVQFINPIQSNQQSKIDIDIDPTSARVFCLQPISSCSIEVVYQSLGINGTRSAPQSGQPLPVVNGRTAILQQTPQGIIDLV